MTTTTTPDQEPSMDEILSSIRRILKDDEPVTMAPEPQPAAPHGTPVLDLDASMIVPDGEPEPIRQMPAASGIASSSVFSSATPPGTATDITIDSGQDPHDSAPHGIEAPKPLIGAQTASATATHIEALVRTVTADRNLAIRSGGATVEDMVREELRPLLKSWLDTHLPGLVERIVRAEIERLVGRDGA